MARRVYGASVALGITLVVAACAPATPSVTPNASDLPASMEPSAPTSEASATPTPGPVGWREITPAAGPTPREDATWTVDGDGTVAYLFGGREGASVYGDLWAYDLATDSWAQVTSGGPEPRFGHSAAWVDGVGLVVFAGQGVASFFNDLWAFDPAASTWTRLPPGGAVPVARYGSCAALGPDGRLWISHGFTSEGSRFADTRAYDFDTGTWTDETPIGDAPVERCLHGCWWTEGTFNLYAGQTTGTLALGDWWALTIGSRPGTNTWAEVAIGGGGLPARNLYGLAGFRGGHLVFGGQANDASYLDDTWLIDHDGAPSEVDLTSVRPAARAGAELVTDVAGDRVLLFGGRGSATHYGDVWELTAP